GLLPSQRLADDAREEARGGLVGLARPDANRRKPNADAVEKSLTRVIRQQQLANGLLGPVGRQRRRKELIADRLGKRGTEHSDGAGEHDAWLIAGLANSFEQISRAVEINAIALVEIQLSFARDNSGEMEDHVRLVGHQLIGLPWPGEVTHLDGHRKWTVAATLSLDDIVQHDAGDRSAGEAAIPRQALRQFLANHAGTADDQDFHDVAPPLRSFVVELPGGLSRGGHRTSRPISILRQCRAVVCT